MQQQQQQFSTQDNKQRLQDKNARSIAEQPASQDLNIYNEHEISDDQQTVRRKNAETEEMVMLVADEDEYQDLTTPDELQRDSCYGQGNYCTASFQNANLCSSSKQENVRGEAQQQEQQQRYNYLEDSKDDGCILEDSLIMEESMLRVKTTMYSSSQQNNINSSISPKLFTAKLSPYLNGTPSEDQLIYYQESGAGHEEIMLDSLSTKQVYSSTQLAQFNKSPNNRTEQAVVESARVNALMTLGDESLNSYKQAPSSSQTSSMAVADNGVSGAINKQHSTTRGAYETNHGIFMSGELAPGGLSRVMLSDNNSSALSSPNKQKKKLKNASLYSDKLSKIEALQDIFKNKIKEIQTKGSLQQKSHNPSSQQNFQERGNSPMTSNNDQSVGKSPSNASHSSNNTPRFEKSSYQSQQTKVIDKFEENLTDLEESISAANNVDQSLTQQQQHQSASRHFESVNDSSNSNNNVKILSKQAMNDRIQHPYSSVIVPNGSNISSSNNYSPNTKNRQFGTNAQNHLALPEKGSISPSSSQQQQQSLLSMGQGYFKKPGDQILSNLGSFVETRINALHVMIQEKRKLQLMIEEKKNLLKQTKQDLISQQKQKEVNSLEVVQAQQKQAMLVEQTRDLKQSICIVQQKEEEKSIDYDGLYLELDIALKTQQDNTHIMEVSLARQREQNELKKQSQAQEIQHLKEQMSNAEQESCLLKQKRDQGDINDKNRIQFLKEKGCDLEKIMQGDKLYNLKTVQSNNETPPPSSGKSKQSKVIGGSSNQAQRTPNSKVVRGGLISVFNSTNLADGGAQFNKTLQHLDLPNFSTTERSLTEGVATQSYATKSASSNTGFAVSLNSASSQSNHLHTQKSYQSQMMQNHQPSTQTNTIKKDNNNENSSVVRQVSYFENDTFVTAKSSIELNSSGCLQNISNLTNTSQLGVASSQQSKLKEKDSKPKPVAITNNSCRVITTRKPTAQKPFTNYQPIQTSSSTSSSQLAINKACSTTTPTKAVGSRVALTNGFNKSAKREQPNVSAERAKKIGGQYNQHHQNHQPVTNGRTIKGKATDVISPIQPVLVGRSISPINSRLINNNNNNLTTTNATHNINTSGISGRDSSNNRMGHAIVNLF